MPRQSSRDSGHSQSGSTSPVVMSQPYFIAGPPLKKGTLYKMSRDGTTLTAQAELLDKNAFEDDRSPPSSVDIVPARRINDQRRLVQIPEGLVIAIPDELLRLMVIEFGRDRLSYGALSEVRRLSNIAVQAGAIGFWNRRPFLYQVLEPQRSNGFPGLNGEMFNRSDEEIRDVVKALESRLDNIGEYVWAYAGWLFSNPQFRSEQRMLLQEFRNEIVSVGFPTRQMLLSGRPLGNPTFHERCLRHYQHWILDGVAGPDLPVPVAPQFPNPIQRETSSGVLSHSIPAYFPIPGQGWFLDMLDDSRPTQRQMSHLADWFEIVRKRNASFNKMEAFRRRMRLLHYWRGLVLAFPDLLRRSKVKLTGVFARFSGASEDTIKRDLRVLRPLLSEEWLLPP